MTAPASRSFYEKLPEQHIRLLYVEGTCLVDRPPARARDLAISCRLETVSRDSIRRGDVVYEALSYCWGPPTELWYGHASFDGHLVRITRNLYEYLWQRVFSSPDAGELRPIWIDALCINQTDLEEKSEQVRLMGETYSTASLVIVWLGNCTVTDSVDLIALWRIMSAGEPALARPGTKLIQDGRRYLYGCEWFRRCWTLQEIALAQRAQVQWGPLTVEWGTLVSFCGETPTSDSGSVKAIESAATLQFDRLDRKSLGALIAGSGGRKSSDPRDRVYSLLGLYQGPEQFLPDYTLSIDEVFAQYNMALIRELGYLYFLERIQTNHDRGSVERGAPAAEISFISWAARPEDWDQIPVGALTSIKGESSVGRTSRDVWNLEDLDPNLKPEWQRRGSKLSCPGILFRLGYSPLTNMMPGKRVLPIGYDDLPPCLTTLRLGSLGDFGPVDAGSSFLDQRTVFDRLDAHHKQLCSCEPSVSTRAALGRPDDVQLWACILVGSTGPVLLYPELDRTSNELAFRIFDHFPIEGQNGIVVNNKLQYVLHGTRLLDSVWRSEGSYTPMEYEWVQHLPRIRDFRCQSSCFEIL